MNRRMTAIALLAFAGACVAAQQTQYHLGRPATPEEIRSRAISVAPDGTGLPNGHGCGSPKLSAEASERGASWDRGLSTIIAPIQNENSGGHKLEAACAWSVHIYKDRRKVDPE